MTASDLCRWGRAASRRILTVDLRDFRAVPTSDGQPWLLLPEGGY